MNHPEASRLSAMQHSYKRTFAVALAGMSTLWVPRVGHAFPPATPVTGSGADGTFGGNQAETVCNISTVGGTSVESIAYNDDSNQPGLTAYSDTSPFRTRLAGFSAMAWSNRTRSSGGQWGPWTHFIVPPPQSLGWDILWGDPSLASNPGMSNVVFMGTLAIPHDKLMFVSGLHPALSNNAVLGVVTEDTKQDIPTPVGGGCIARSTDGGRTFSIVDCVRDTSSVASPLVTPNISASNAFGHFYDGSSLAVTQNPTGSFSAFAAFIDEETNREAIFSMPDITDITSNAPHPFQPDNTVVGNTGAQTTGNDSLGDIDTHVRLLASGATLWKMSAQGSSTKLALSSNNKTSLIPASLKMNLRNRNAGPIPLAPNAVIGEAVDLGKDALSGKEITLRTATQFAFDVGVNELGAPEMRFVYMAADVTANAGTLPDSASNFHLRGGLCSLQDPQNPSCHLVPEWVTPPSDNAMELFPAIKFAMLPGSSTPVWKVTFQRRDPQNPSQLAIFQADLVTPSFAPQSPTFTEGSGLNILQVTPFQTPCPDVRSATVDGSSSATPGAGYWGDYDYMMFDATTGNFVRAFTDSTQNCDTRLPLTSHNVHVSIVEIPTTPAQAVVSLAGVQFGTTGFNFCSACNCINSLPDATITCTPVLGPGGVLSTQPGQAQQQLGCGDGHGALVTVTCSGTGTGPGLNVTVNLSIENSCGSFTETVNETGNQTFSASNLLPGQSQTGSQFLVACDSFGGMCTGVANGGACTFNSFDANVTVSTTGGF